MEKESSMYGDVSWKNIHSLQERIIREVDKFSSSSLQLLTTWIDIVERRRALASYHWMTDEQKSMIYISGEGIVVKWVGEFCLYDEPDMPFKEAEDIWIPNRNHWSQLIKKVLFWWTHQELYKFFREVFKMWEKAYWCWWNHPIANVSSLFVIKEQPREELLMTYLSSDALDKNPFMYSDRMWKQKSVRRLLKSYYSPPEIRLVSRKTF